MGTITDRMAVRKAVQCGQVEDAIEKVNDLNPEVCLCSHLCLTWHVVIITLSECTTLYPWVPLFVPVLTTYPVNTVGWLLTSYLLIVCLFSWGDLLAVIPFLWNCSVSNMLQQYGGAWQILDTNPQLFFHLQQQRLIELIRSGQVEEALEFAQEELAPRGEENVCWDTERMTRGHICGLLNWKVIWKSFCAKAVCACNTHVMCICLVMEQRFRSEAVI